MATCVEQKSAPEDISAKDEHGYTILHHEAGCHHVDRVADLLKHGASLEGYSDTGLLPLHCVFLGTGVPGAEEEVWETETEAGEQAKNNRIISILDLMFAHGCDLNAKTLDGRSITDLEKYWEVKDIYQWILQKPFILPNFEEMVKTQPAFYGHARDQYHHYLQAGSTDLLCIHSTAALAMLARGKQDKQFNIVSYCYPQEVSRMDFRFLVMDGFGESLEKLEPCIAYFIGFIYRVCSDGCPWYQNEADLLQDGGDSCIYFKQKKMKHKVLRLKHFCLMKIRSEIFSNNGGRSVLPYIDKLPLPKTLKDYLKIPKDHDNLMDLMF